MKHPLREFARGLECLIRVPGVCRWTDSQLCHLRIGSVAGIGQKAPDTIAVIGCTACHDVIDRRTHLNQIPCDAARMYALEALVRTIALYEKHGILRVDEDTLKSAARDLKGGI